MLRTCWWIDRRWAESNDTIEPGCTCATKPPDFRVKLPAVMDFSPTTIPTTPAIEPTTDAIMSTGEPSFTTFSASSLRTEPAVPPVSQNPAENAADNAASTLKDRRLMLVATTSSGGACVILLLLILLLYAIYKCRERIPSNREIDVVPVTTADGSLQDAPSPGELKRVRADPLGNNNPSLTASNDTSLNGSANLSSNNATKTDTIVTMADTNLRGDPV